MTKVEQIKDILNVPNGWRLGQYIWNSMALLNHWKAPEANALFYISDEDLNKIID